MKNDNYLDLFDSKQKAIDHVMWLNFKTELLRLVLALFMVQIIIGLY